MLYSPEQNKFFNMLFRHFWKFPASALLEKSLQNLDNKFTKYETIQQAFLTQNIYDRGIPCVWKTNSDFFIKFLKIVMK